MPPLKASLTTTATLLFAIVASSSASSSDDDTSMSTHDVAGVVFGGVIVTLIAGTGAAFLHKHKVLWFPESAWYILFGALVGVVIKYVYYAAWSESGGGQTSRDLIEKSIFPPTMFTLILLPPLMFDAGFRINPVRFLDNVGAIMLFAIVGSLISTFLTGVVLYGSGQAGIVGMVLPLKEAFAFASLISATDPVATLSVFGAVGVDPNLESMIAGESLFNDAVAIVLFRTFESFIHEGEDLTDAPWQAAATGIGTFFKVSLGSVAIGQVWGYAMALYFKYSPVTTGHCPELETFAFFVLSISAFQVAEYLHLSGIIAALFCGMCCGHFARYNLSDSGLKDTERFYSKIVVLCDLQIFVRVGIGMVLFEAEWHHLGFAALAMIMCLISRAMNVFPLSAAYNSVRVRAPTQADADADADAATSHTTKHIPMNQQMMMWFSGLRGAVAVSLALELKDALDHSESDNGDGLVGTCFIIVLITVFGLGCTTTKMLSVLKIEQGVKETPNFYEHHTAICAMIQKLEIKMESHRIGFFNRLKLWALRLNEQKLDPMLLTNPACAKVNHHKTQWRRMSQRPCASSSSASTASAASAASATAPPPPGGGGGDSPFASENPLQGEEDDEL